MFTKELLAERLNGREYTEEITKDEEAEAKIAGLVVVFGASDDLMEFRGAIRDELGAYNGTTALVYSGGVLPERDNIDSDDDDALCAYFKNKDSALEIDAVWDDNTGGYSWTFKTAIPHATFDIMEGDEKYCRGIVFDLPKKTPELNDAEDAKRYRFMRDRGTLQIDDGLVVVDLKKDLVAEDGEDIQNSVFDAAIDKSMCQSK